MRKFLVSLALVLFVAAFAFSVYVVNQDQFITFKYVFDIEWTANIATFLFLTFVIGMIVGALLVSFSLLGQKMKTGKANRQLKKVEKEVEGLRAASPD